MTLVRLPGGLRLWTRVDGNPEKPWLVLSNSIMATDVMWDAQMNDLVKTYRVLRYHARGHGLSDRPAGPYTFDNLASDVLALMDHFEMKNPAFMGLSLGGMTGLGVALKAPSRLRALVCCDARADAPPAFVQGWNDRINLVRTSGIEAIADGTLERWLSAPFRATHPEAVEKVMGMMLTTSGVGFEGCAEALKKLSYLDQLDQIHIPTLFVVGSEDAGAPAAVMRQMSERVAGSRLAIIQGSAHLPNIDNPPEFLSAISNFLQLD
jgi:3-oxoadipate enol-lactonase